MIKATWIKDIFDNKMSVGEIAVRGWVRSVRKKKSFSFMVINDGSCQKNLQIVLDSDIENYEILCSSLAGSCVSITGELVESKGKNQSYEVVAKNGEVLGESQEDYPLQKKATSLEFLRENAHLRARTNLFGAVFRIRNTLAYATHQFFQNNGFYYINTPIITGIDAEGAGEMFNVSILSPDKIHKSADGSFDYKKDYFGKNTSLTVSGQLEAETFAMGMGKVYTFGPTFRSENSNTARHLAEFWMIEPEVAFADLDDVAKLGADYIKYLIGSALENCREELSFLEKRDEVDNGLIDRLEIVANSGFTKITYTNAVEVLNNCGKKFEFPVEWGKELQTEHERYLSEEKFNGPVIVTDYPKECKAFYMKQNEDGKTVRAMDILLPGVGEIIGGSQREESLSKLKARMDEMEMEQEALWWYLDLRKHGTAPHAGFGLGFERAVMYITGMKNIRDVIPFPRTPKSADF
jgi:asparaginyl-tRNA synthetase